MIKDIVVNLSTADSEDVISDLAISVANLFEAHLSGIAFAYQPEFPTVGYGEIPTKYIDEMVAESRQRAAVSIDAFNEATRRAGLSSSSRQVEIDIGSSGDAFARIARNFDLSIVKQVERGHATASDSIPEVTLLGSGRPVLIVPFRATTTPPEQVASRREERPAPRCAGFRETGSRFGHEGGRCRSTE